MQFAVFMTGNLTANAAESKRAHRLTMNAAETRSGA